uniref:Aminotransferase-like plant mobile domain-containing protein n=1 Tax=Oryza punctata TaxID=4537 RepID=A0A0E0KEV4_ORYPU
MQTLKPILFNEAGVYDLPCYTTTLAQQFINSSTRRWVEGQPVQLRTEVSPNEKLMLWARMLLVNPEDSAYLTKAGIFRGVMASIYKCQIQPALVAVFLIYLNVNGHTLITNQGEMGYPLQCYGHPSFWTPLRRIYPATIHCSWPFPGLVPIATWVDHFFGVASASLQSFLPDGFVDPTEPLYEDKDFHVELRNDRPTAIMCDLEMSYKYTYPLVVYRAAFIAV